MEQYRKAIVAVVGVVLMLVAQLFHVTVPGGLDEALVQLVLAVVTVVGVYRARNVHPVVVAPPTNLPLR